MCINFMFTGPCATWHFLHRSQSRGPPKGRSSVGKGLRLGRRRRRAQQNETSGTSCAHVSTLILPSSGKFLMCACRADNIKAMSSDITEAAALASSCVTPSKFPPSIGLTTGNQTSCSVRSKCRTKGWSQHPRLDWKSYVGDSNSIIISCLTVSSVSTLSVEWQVFSRLNLWLSSSCTEGFSPRLRRRK